MISSLLLPKPSVRLVNAALHIANNVSICNGSKKYFDHSQDHLVNSIEGGFMQDTFISEQIKKEFQSYFTESFYEGVGIYRNIATCKFAHLPPHVDKHTQLSLNFVLSTGGSNVTTTVYKMNKEGVTNNFVQMEKYNALTIMHSEKLLENNWYALDVQSYHSVDNIESQRVLLSLCFPTINFSFFKEKYLRYLAPRPGLEQVISY